MSLIYKDKKTGGKIYQCGAKEIPSYLRSKDIDLIILSAKEFQPQLQQNITKVHVPFNDKAVMSEIELAALLDKAIKASSYAVDTVSSGGVALITCWAGLNRSGLITGMTLIDHAKLTGDQAIKTIQRHRKGALFNPLFRQILKCY